jgi:urease accessory protein
VNSGRGQQQGHQFAKDEVEVWSMARYASSNEVMIGDKVIMRERMVLDNSNRAIPDISRHLAPYNVYATVLIAGPKFATLIEHLKIVADEVQQFQLHRPQVLTWAFSVIDEGRAGVLRLAAVEVEDVRIWLREHMDKGGVKDLVGEGLWPRVV